MTKAPDVEGLSYEQALGELDTLITQLERGDVDLDEAIRAYERGALLAQRCAELLDRTEAAVTQLVVGAQGALQERPLRPAAEPPPDDAPAGGRATERPVAPPPPGAPVRARVAPREPLPEPRTHQAPGLFPGLEPGPPPDAAGKPDFDLDDIPF